MAEGHGEQAVYAEKARCLGCSTRYARKASDVTGDGGTKSELTARQALQSARSPIIAGLRSHRGFLASEAPVQLDGR